MVMGDAAPPRETLSHGYLYRVTRYVEDGHTHRTYARAWAARGEPLPCVLTTRADEFDGKIPIGPFAPIGGDDTGKGIVATLTQHRDPAVLMTKHGVFANERDAARGREGGGHVRGPGPSGPQLPAARPAGASRVDGR